ncbi:hypothetical protein TCON_0674 [Astathelohania contejeani]|uniref:Uncharacterized protein n=1 Tax=Astathelohania contejeani TaxID=164912 RepID=A0ABQ7I0Y5_9MICR|nr:hypothetical protein TCON_0674 [Thelohania contejeani]
MMQKNSPGRKTGLFGIILALSFFIFNRDDGLNIDDVSLNTKNKEYKLIFLNEENLKLINNGGWYILVDHGNLDLSNIDKIDIKYNLAILRLNTLSQCKIATLFNIQQIPSIIDPKKTLALTNNYDMIKAYDHYILYYIIYLNKVFRDYIMNHSSYGWMLVISLLGNHISIFKL